MANYWLYVWDNCVGFGVLVKQGASATIEN